MKQVKARVREEVQGNDFVMNQPASEKRERRQPRPSDSPPLSSMRRGVSSGVYALKRWRRDADCANDNVRATM